MKKLCLLISCCFYFFSIHAQSWQPLGPDDHNWASTGEADFPNISNFGSSPYVVMKDWANGGRATVRMFNGNTWVNVGTPGFSTGLADFANIAFNGTDPYVVYQDRANGGKATVKTYNGSTWQNLGTGGFSSGDAWYTVIAFDGTTPYVAYQDMANGSKATVKKYNGSSWVDVGTPGISAGIATSIDIAIYGSTPYISYLDGVNNYRATVKKFNGTNWEDVGTPAATGSSNTRIAFNGTTLYLVFGNKVQRFNGTNWEDVSSTSFTTGSASNTAITFNGSTPFIAYKDGSNGGKITVKKFDGSSWVSVGNPGFSIGGVDHTNITMLGATPYVIYKDVAYRGKATVKMVNGTGWVDIGTPGISAAYANYTSLAIQNGTPYVAYSDAANGSKTSVKKYNGTSWEYVGSPGFSLAHIEHTGIAFDGNVPHVVFKDWHLTRNGKATVMKFTGTIWVEVGTPGFSAGNTAWTTIAFNGEHFYVAYMDLAYNSRATVKMFNGSQWVDVGTPGFSAGSAEYMKIVCNGPTPYVIYTDGGNGGKLTVKKFNGSNWEDVGIAGFTPGGAALPDLAFNGSIPYAAYMDRTNLNRISVKMFNGNSWTDVGSPGFSTRLVYDVNIAFHGSTPYVVYRDFLTAFQSNNDEGRATAKMFNGTSWVEVGSAEFSAGKAEFISMAIANNKVVVAYSNCQVYAKYFQLTPPETITTSSVSTPLCQGASLSVDFTITGKFNNSNTFSAQLSDANGSFTSPINIGSIASTSAATIDATIPANTPTGTGHRIRVVSSDPDVTGIDNDSDLEINAPILWYLDADDDGYYTGSGVSSCSSPGLGYKDSGLIGGGDCNDSNNSINPGAVEICDNSVDDNCNNQVDENCISNPLGISIDDVTVYESDGVALLTVSLSRTYSQSIKINFATQDGTAVGNLKGQNPANDFVAIKGSLTIPANTLTGTVLVNIIADNLVEPQEYFFVDLSVRKNSLATLERARATVYINDGNNPDILTSNNKYLKNDILENINFFHIKALPNPSNNYFTIINRSDINKPITIRVIDNLGRIVEARKNIAPNNTLQIGHYYKPGSYLIEVVQGEQRQILKVIKTN